MAESYFFAFDSETGGLDPAQADMLTFYGGLFEVHSLKMVDEVNFKLKPNDGRLPIADAGALRVNGINIQAHLADPETLTYADAMPKLEAMLKKFSKKNGRTLNIKPFGFNVPFDEKFTFQHLMPQATWNKFMHYKKVDVMDRVDFLKESGWLPKEIGTLVSVNDFLNLPKRAAHDAKNDTYMTVDVYAALLKLMQSKKEGGSTQDLISLLEAE